jgi:hypothetical protein
MYFLQKSKKKKLWPISKYNIDIHLEELRKTMKICSQDSIVKHTTV